MNEKKNEPTDYSKKLMRAMEITELTEAQNLFAELVNDCRMARIREGEPADLKTCVSIQKQNLGYFAGYYDSKTRERVERLFDCEHPVFGSIKEKGSPSAKEAFEMGVKLGKKIKRKRMTK